MAGKRKPKGKLSDRKIRELVFSAGEFCLEKKADEVVLLDLRKISDMTDYFLIAGGYTDIHVRAVAGHVVEALNKKYKLDPWHVEGLENGRWVLLDYVDFVVHIFQSETRKFYQLEHLWSDARRSEIKDEPALSEPG